MCCQPTVTLVMAANKKSTCSQINVSFQILFINNSAFAAVLILRLTSTLGRQTHPCSVASGVINSVLPGGPPPNICNLKIQKFKPTVCRSEAKVRETARYTAPCCPDAVTASEMSLSIISGLHPLEVFSPVVTIKYGRAVVNRTRESTFHMNPA